MFRTALTRMRSRMSLPALAAGATVLTSGAVFATSPETRARFAPVFDINRSMQQVSSSLTFEATALPTILSVAHAAASVDYNAVRKDIERLIEDENCGPVLVRLSWHASGTYDKHTKTGGSERASMRFKPESEHGANAGLGSARSLLEPIKAKYPGISYADLWSLAAVVAISEMGGPEIAWRPGRKDAADSSSCTPDGRLPDAAQGASHIRDIFYRMGFNDQEITALVGAHSVGRCHKDRSGYDGPWTHDPYGFDNSFYIQLLEDKWTVKKGSDPLQYEDEATRELMMLPSDMAFLWDKEFRKWVEIYAKDDDRWRRDFAAAFKKLQELGVKF